MATYFDTLVDLDNDTFKSQYLNKRPLCLSSQRARKKRIVTGLVTWENLNLHLNREDTDHSPAKMHLAWKLDSELILENQRNFNPRLDEVCDLFENLYDNKYTAKCDILMRNTRSTDDESEMTSFDEDTFFIIVRGTGQLCVYPKKRTNDESWKEGFEDFLLPIVDQRVLESSIVYLPAKIFHSFSLTNSPSLVIKLTMTKGKPKKSKRYDFMLTDKMKVKNVNPEFNITS